MCVCMHARSMYIIYLVHNKHDMHDIVSMCEYIPLMHMLSQSVI